MNKKIRLLLTLLAPITLVSCVEKQTDEKSSSNSTNLTQQTGDIDSSKPGDSTQTKNIIDKYVNLLNDKVGFSGYYNQYEIDEATKEEVFKQKIYLQTNFSEGKFFTQEYYYVNDDKTTKRIDTVSPTKYFKDEDTGYVCYNAVNIDNTTRKEFTKDIDDNGNAVTNTDQFDDYYINPLSDYEKEDYEIDPENENVFTLNDETDVNRVSMFITRLDEKINTFKFIEENEKLRLEIETKPYVMEDEDNDNEKVTTLSRYYFDVDFSLQAAYTISNKETKPEHETVRKALEKLSNMNSYTLIHTETKKDQLIDQHEIRYVGDDYLNYIDVLRDYGDNDTEQFSPNGIAKFKGDKFYKYTFDKNTNQVNKGVEVTNYKESKKDYVPVFSGVAAEMFTLVKDGIYICDDPHVYGTIASRFAADKDEKIRELYNGKELYIEVKDDTIVKYYWEIENLNPKAGKDDLLLTYTFKDINSTTLPVDFSTLN